MRPIAKAAAMVAVLLVGAGCLELEVTNPNAPDRSKALASDRDVETLIGSSFSAWWDLKHGGSGADRHGAVTGLCGYADVCNGLGSEGQDYAWQPRKELPNQIGFQWGYPIRDPWLLGARTLGAIRDALGVIEAGLKIGANGVDTPRAQAFGAFMQGLILGHFAKLYDQSFVEDPTKDAVAQVESKDLRPYPEVLQSSLAALARARDIASRNAFTTPATWIAAQYTNKEIVRLTYSFAARFRASVARTPTVRAAVDWSAVIADIDRGIVKDFGVQVEPGATWARNGSGSVSQAFVGRADQSGRWQAWEAKPVPNERVAFYVETDDRRIHAPGNPQRSGTLFELDGTISGDVSRGSWSGTYYQTLKYRSISETGFGFVDEITVREMELLKAEGLIRLNRAAEALPLINKSRVAAGLPPATVNGVVGQTRCVPKTPTGECGGLLYTLLYEKSMETLFQTAGLAYWDARGFGTLREGSAVHLPLPADELENLQIPVYSFGGVGGKSVSPGWILK